MKTTKLFQKTLFGIFLLFGFVGVSTSMLCVYTVDTHLSAEYENNSKSIAKTIADFGHTIVPLDMSEFRKMDGSLSCLSLRF